MKQMFLTWVNVITHPNKVTFDNQLSMAHATQKTAVSWLGVGVLLAAIVNGISSFIYESIFTSYVGSRQAMAIALLQLPKENSALIDFFGSPIFGGIFSFLGFLIGAPIILFLGNAVSLWLAKTFSGTGSFEKQLFAMASFAPALFIIANVLGVFHLS